MMSNPMPWCPSTVLSEAGIITRAALVERQRGGFEETTVVSSLLTKSRASISGDKPKRIPNDGGNYLSNTPSRKLAVILHADVVCSTALVQQIESVAHDRIHDAFKRFIETTD